MEHFERANLPQVKEGLSEIFGTDLAESLVNAARSKDFTNFDHQMLMNDGLNLISVEQKNKALELLDFFATSLT